MSGQTQWFVDQKLKQWPVCVFSKSTDPECFRAKQILNQYLRQMPYETIEYVEIEKRADCESIENYLIRLSLNDSRIVSIWWQGDDLLKAIKFYDLFFVTYRYLKSIYAESILVVYLN
jgi:hypothetical protein